MSLIIETKYLGELRTSSTHLKSSQTIITDAPLDNNGKGEAFSPTDLLCASLATCMLTIMGIVASKHGWNIDGIDCKVSKTMSPAPRKVAEIVIEFLFPKNNFNEEEQEILRQAAYSCPVALSLHPDLKKIVSFKF